MFPYFLVLLAVLLASPGSGLDIRQRSIVTPRRLELTREYCRLHYGLDTYVRRDPQMIVIHYTAGASLKGDINTFMPDTIATARGYLGKFGKLNVGVQYLVAANGEVCQLLPDTIIGRHTIGFNHCAIGIENSARGQNQLTTKQLEADAELIRMLLDRHSSIKYLIGHDEYMNRALPHSALRKELVKEYKPTVKSDPGKRFMARLRQRLKDKHQIVLEP